MGYKLLTMSALEAEACIRDTLNTIFDGSAPLPTLQPVELKLFGEAEAAQVVMQAYEAAPDNPARRLVGITRLSGATIVEQHVQTPEETHFNGFHERCLQACTRIILGKELTIKAVFERSRPTSAHLDEAALYGFKQRLAETLIEVTLAGAEHDILQDDSSKNARTLAVARTMITPDPYRMLPGQRVPQDPHQNEVIKDRLGIQPRTLY